MSDLTPDGPREPELLELGGGAPMRSAHTPRRVRRGVLAFAGVAALGLGGVGVWATMSYLATGPQPAESLPATTLAYASVDLDPSGEQKLAAVRMLRQFPAIRDEIGLDTTDDLRQALFESLQDESDACADLDYARDVEPWLGDRMAVALLDSDAEAPTPVAVLQVSDAGEAEAGLTALSACSEEAGGTPLGSVVGDGWAVLAESDEIAEQALADAGEASLADDENYRTWTDQAGDPGIINFYAADGLGEMLAQQLEGLGLPGERVDAGALQSYGATAGALRFGADSVELEVVSDTSGASLGGMANDRGDDVVSRLPVDTALALGAGFEEGWTSSLMDQLALVVGADLDSLLAQASERSGLDLPEDVETLTGESMAISVGSGIDADAIMQMTTPEVPVAWTVQGDSTSVESVLDAVRTQFGPLAAEVLGSDSEGDLTVIGPDADYRAAVLAGGELGELEAFRDAVPEAERASVVFFANFDRDGWLSRVAGDDPASIENLEPLRALGISAWLDGDAGHGLLRLTTD